LIDLDFWFFVQGFTLTDQLKNEYCYSHKSCKQKNLFLKLRGYFNWWKLC
jgi:hypothetical protein